MSGMHTRSGRDVDHTARLRKIVQRAQIEKLEGQLQETMNDQEQIFGDPWVILGHGSKVGEFRVSTTSSNPQPQDTRPKRKKKSRPPITIEDPFASSQHDIPFASQIDPIPVAPIPVAPIPLKSSVAERSKSEVEMMLGVYRSMSYRQTNPQLVEGQRRVRRSRLKSTSRRRPRRQSTTSSTSEPSSSSGDDEPSVLLPKLDCSNFQIDTVTIGQTSSRYTSAHTNTNTHTPSQSLVSVVFSKTVAVSGVGFFADAYDLFVIDLVMAILVVVSVRDGPRQLAKSDQSLIAAATLAGAVCGQIGFGASSDYIGRRVLFITTAALVVIGGLSSSLVQWTTDNSAFSLSKQLAVCRFLLGVGIGGEYPLAATVTSESYSGDVSRRSQAVAAVFSMQGLGMLASCVIVLSCLKMNISLEVCWRLALGIGAVPSLIAFFWRYRLSESRAFEASHEVSGYRYIDSESPDESIQSHNTTGNNTSNTTGNNTSNTTGDNTTGDNTGCKTKENSSSNAGSATGNTTRYTSDSFPGNTTGNNTGNATGKFCHKERSSRGSVFEMESRMVLPVVSSRELWKKSTLSQHVENTCRTVYRYKQTLLGTALCWFLIDVTLYGTGSFKSVISEQVDEGNSLLEFSGREQIIRDAAFGCKVALMALPGYILSVLFIGATGKRPLQLAGFIIVAFAFIALGIGMMVGVRHKAMEVSLFGLTFLFANFGPNVTTFILPSEIYPTCVRATCHGLSAAAGKAGGAVGAAVFPLLERWLGLPVVMIGCGLVAASGAVVTFLLTPSETDLTQNGNNTTTS